MPNIECVAVLTTQNDSTTLLLNNVTTPTTLHCYFGWKLVGFVPEDSALETAIGTTGFLVFVLVSLAYAFHSVHVQQRGWFANAKLMALYIGMAMLYPFAFLSGMVLVRGSDRHRVNFLLLVAQALIWYTFLRRYIAVMLRVRRTRDGDSDIAHNEYKSNKRHARYLVAIFLTGLVAGQLAGGIVQMLSLIVVAGLAALLLAVDLWGAKSINDGTSVVAKTRRFPKLWRALMPLRVATWVLGVYSMFVAVFTPGFLGVFQVGAEAALVFLEHLALAALAFLYWHLPPASTLTKSSLVRPGDAHKLVWEPENGDDDGGGEAVVDGRGGGGGADAEGGQRHTTPVDSLDHDATALGGGSDGNGGASTLTAIDISSATSAAAAAPSTVTQKKAVAWSLFS